MEEQEVDLDHVHEVTREKAGKIPGLGESSSYNDTLMLCWRRYMFSTDEFVNSDSAKIEASNRWSYYQAKGMKGMLTQSPEEKNRYKEEQQVIQAERLKPIRRKAVMRFTFTALLYRHSSSSHGSRCDCSVVQEKAVLVCQPLP
ncbi:MAG: DUF4337 family protein [Terriglobia bacterium]